MKINSLKKTQEFLQTFIPKNGGQLFTGDWGLARTKYFLNLLGNPQNKLKVIHIAGTSGKGSTATLMSYLLVSQNFTVGLTVSPHIIDLRERCQINNQFISEKEFCLFINELIPYIDKVKRSSFKTPTYFEILIVLAFYIFYKKKVDYAVVETGLGGLYDATNCVSNKNKLAILTKIGFDHTQILGKTLSKIAYQKAMIAQPSNVIISTWQKPTAKKTIINVAKKNNSPLIFLKNNQNCKNIKINNQFTTFDFLFDNLNLNHVKLNLLGKHQVENCSLALIALQKLSQKDQFKLNTNNLRLSLTNIKIPGRMEIFHKYEKTIIADGAHNPQKMKAFIHSLKKLYPHKKFNFLITFKEKKDFKQMVKYIIPLANKIVITSFFTTNQELINLSSKPEVIAEEIKKNKFHNYNIIINPQEALQSLIRTSPQSRNPLIITGSFYLIGEIYSVLLTT